MKTQKRTSIMGIFAVLAILGLLTGCPKETKEEKPAKPTGISASAASDGITVSWHKASGASTYDLWRKESGSSGVGVGVGVSGAGALSVTSYTDKNGIPGRQYQYAVYAMNSVGTSEMSDWTEAVSFPTSSSQKPNTPTGVQATAQSSTAITISWYGQSDVIGYIVYHDTSSSGAFNTPVSGFDPVKDITLTDIGLTPNTTYWYKVSAINGAGEGNKSSPTVSATTLQDNLSPQEINWISDQDGTLTIINQTNFDMVLFHTTPSLTSIIGGVRSQTEVTKDISNKVPNFMIGGPMVIRAMKYSEYLANINALSKGRIEYTAFTAYGQGKKYRAILTSQWDGDYSYLVQNTLFNCGVELRKDSKNGDMVSYLSAATSPTHLYATSESTITLYPVYVAYNTQSQSLVYYEPKAWKEVQDVVPCANPTQVYLFPPEDAGVNPFNEIDIPYATIIVQHNATRVANFRVGTVAQTGQSKYPQIDAGAREVFDITGGDITDLNPDGIEVALNFSLLTNTVQVPVKFADQTTANPKIKNGYIYNVVLTYTGTDIEDPNHYTAVIMETGQINTEGFLIAH